MLNILDAVDDLDDLVEYECKILSKSRSCPSRPAFLIQEYVVELEREQTLRCHAFENHLVIAFAFRPNSAHHLADMVGAQFEELLPRSTLKSIARMSGVLPLRVILQGYRIDLNVTIDEVFLNVRQQLPSLDLLKQEIVYLPIF